MIEVLIKLLQILLIGGMGYAFAVLVRCRHKGNWAWFHMVDRDRCPTGEYARICERCGKVERNVEPPG